MCIRDRPNTEEGNTPSDPDSVVETPDDRARGPTPKPQEEVTLQTLMVAMSEMFEKQNEYYRIINEKIDKQNENNRIIREEISENNRIIHEKFNKQSEIISETFKKQNEIFREQREGLSLIHI